MSHQQLAIEFVPLSVLIPPSTPFSGSKFQQFFCLLVHTDIPSAWEKRATAYAQSVADSISDESMRNDKSSSVHQAQSNSTIIKIENELIYPSELGNFIYSVHTNENAIDASGATTIDQRKLVCYYSTPVLNHSSELYPDRIDAKLCTHINIGMVWVEHNVITIDDALKELFKQTSQLKRINPELKVLVWVGGISSYGFSQMVKNHANRKSFIRSLKSILEEYRLDGVDIDWEFPSAHNRERQHFSQLLHEIRREYEREHRTYLLTVAVAAPEGIVFYAYDIGEINKYADFVNIMTYDYHFYSKAAPFTGK